MSCLSPSSQPDRGRPQPDTSCSLFIVPSEAFDSVLIVFTLLFIVSHYVILASFLKICLFSPFHQRFLALSVVSTICCEMQQPLLIPVPFLLPRDKLLLVLPGYFDNITNRL